MVVGATFPLTAHAAAENKTGGVTSAGTVPDSKSLIKPLSFYVHGTDCRVFANDPHISEHAKERGIHAVGADGGVSCHTPKSRIWVRVRLQHLPYYFGNNWVTIKQRSINKTRGNHGPHPAGNRPYLLYKCQSRINSGYRLRVKATIVTLSGKVHRYLYSNSRQPDPNLPCS